MRFAEPLRFAACAAAGSGAVIALHFFTAERTPPDLTHIGPVSELLRFGNVNDFADDQWDVISPDGSKLIRFRRSFEDSSTVLWVTFGISEALPDTIWRWRRHPMRTWGMAPMDTVIIEGTGGRPR